MTKGTRRADPGEAREFFYSQLYVVQDACKIWPFGRSGRYGVLTIDKQQYGVHRLACLAWNGPCPPGMETAHGPCNRTLCFHGGHVSWKLPADNMRDQFRDGTAPVGALNPAAILDDATVLAIRQRYAAGGVRQEDLAMEFGLNQASISDLIRGNTWAHLPGVRPSRRRLTESEVTSLLADRATSGLTQKALASKYGVSQALVSLLVNGQRHTWKRLT